MSNHLPSVAHCANPYLGLTEVWIYDQIRTLRRYSPFVITQAVQNRDRFPVDNLYSTEKLEPWVRKVFRAIRKAKGTYPWYGRILKRENASLIHAHFGQEGYRVLGGKKAAGLPMVTGFYGLDISVLPRQWIWRRRYRRLFDEGDLFLVEGSQMGKRLVSLGCPEEKVRVQRLGVDLEEMGDVSERSDEQAEEPIILMYASLREKKGHVYGLRAISRILESHPTVRVRLIGDGPLRAQVENEIRSLNLGDRVEMLGYLPRDECLKELRQATVLLYPSVTASDGDTEGGAPVALIEAMAVGMPVISSLHADIPEVVPHDRCGLLCPERDVGALSEALDAIVGSPELREQMRRDGPAHVEQNHNLERQARSLEEIYDEARRG